MHQESPNTSLQAGHALRGRPISQFRPPLKVSLFQPAAGARPRVSQAQSRAAGRNSSQNRNSEFSSSSSSGSGGGEFGLVGARAPAGEAGRPHLSQGCNYMVGSSRHAPRESSQHRMQPNPSVKRSANGLPPVPGRLWVCENLSRPGPGGKPSSPAYLER
jgi:hypothetical protein